VRGVPLAKNAPHIQFELVADDAPARPSRRTVRVLIDLDGDGASSRGDYLNTQSIPVAAGAGRTTVNVPVRRI
jgi:hypothetical protein